jgi:hypothetical protein
LAQGQDDRLTTSAWSHADHILAALRQQPPGASDAELSHRLCVRPQTVNATCRKLAARGLIIRESQGGTLINRALMTDREVNSTAISFESVETASTPSSRPWYWEGHFQAKVVEFLVLDGWTIVRVADTARREAGKDIEALSDGVSLWVTVKGFPVRTPKTPPETQAPHWFASALLDIVRWRQETSTAQLAIALPVYPTYERLAESTTWLETAAPFRYLWVTELGDVMNNSSARNEARRQQ